jgi:hypothetical protein
MQRQAAWAIGHVVTDSERNKKVLRRQGAVPTLVGLLQSCSTKVVDSVQFALRQLCREEGGGREDWAHVAGGGGGSQGRGGREAVRWDESSSSSSSSSSSGGGSDEASYSSGSDYSESGSRTESSGYSSSASSSSSRSVTASASGDDFSGASSDASWSEPERRHHHHHHAQRQQQQQQQRPRRRRHRRHHKQHDQERVEVGVGGDGRRRVRWVTGAPYPSSQVTAAAPGPRVHGGWRDLAAEQRRRSRGRGVPPSMMSRGEGRGSGIGGAELEGRAWRMTAEAAAVASRGALRRERPVAATRSSTDGDARGHIGGAGGGGHVREEPHRYRHRTRELLSQTDANWVSRKAAGALGL